MRGPWRATGTGARVPSAAVVRSAGGARDRLERAAPYIGKKGARIKDEPDRHRNQRRQAVAQDAEAEVEDEQEQQHRDALDGLDVNDRERPDPRVSRNPYDRHRQADDGAAQKGDDGEAERPARTLQDEVNVVPTDRKSTRLNSSH